MGSEVGKVLESLLGLIWPERCAVCGKILSSEEEKICGECLDDIPLTRFWMWSPNPTEERLWHRAGIISAASLYFYRSCGPYNVLVQKVKYGNERALGLLLGRMLGRELFSCGRFRSIQAVSCIPLHPLRKWRRGYNQAETEAQGLAQELGVPLFPNLLKRRRYTLTQTRLKGKNKERNVRNAFSVNEKQAAILKEKGISHILLVDDVLTSGATMASAAGVLIPEFLVSVATIAFVE